MISQVYGLGNISPAQCNFLDTHSKINPIYGTERTIWRSLSVADFSRLLFNNEILGDNRTLDCLTNVTQFLFIGVFGSGEWGQL